MTGVGLLKVLNTKRLYLLHQVWIKKMAMPALSLGFLSSLEYQGAHYRAHSGFGEPVEKGLLGRAEKSLSSDSNNSIAYRKYSPNQSKSSRLSFGYEKVNKDNAILLIMFIKFSGDLKKKSTRLARYTGLLTNTAHQNPQD